MRTDASRRGVHELSYTSLSALVRQDVCHGVFCDHDANKNIKTDLMFQVVQLSKRRMRRDEQLLIPAFMLVIHTQHWPERSFYGVYAVFWRLCTIYTYGSGQPYSYKFALAYDTCSHLSPPSPPQNNKLHPLCILSKYYNEAESSLCIFKHLSLVHKIY